MEKALKKHAPIFVLPTFLAFVIGFIIPFAQGFYLSFCKFTTVGNATFVGISNYTAAIKDTSFTSSFKFTVLFAIVSILLINVLAFGLALLLTQKLKGTNIFNRPVHMTFRCKVNYYIRAFFLKQPVYSHPIRHRCFHKTERWIFHCYFQG